MPKRKKSTRRPASSRPRDMPDPNPNFISIHQNPNPNFPQQVDLVQPPKPQTCIAGEAEGDVGNDEVEAHGDNPIELDSPVSETPHKRKHDGKQNLGLEKKPKQVDEDEDEKKLIDPISSQGTPQRQKPEMKETEQEAQADPPVTPGNPRKTPKKKKMNARQRAAFEKKLNLIKKNLKPIPFVPQKKLDFAQHEQLFKRLGLWDFVNMKFDQDIRSDLIAILIANYNSSQHYSIVNDVRIKLTRADLARALNLPVKKDKSASLETSDFDSEVLSGEAIAFIVEFRSYWILLHEDTWIMPEEVLSWDALIRSGQPHKVDWPRFIWYMVEKELKNAPETGTLYFASHIQCLMKSQRDALFKEKPLLEVPVEVEDDFELRTGSLKPIPEVPVEVEDDFELRTGSLKPIPEVPVEVEDDFELRIGSSKPIPEVPTEVEDDFESKIGSSKPIPEVPMEVEDDFESKIGSSKPIFEVPMEVEDDFESKMGSLKHIPEVPMEVEEDFELGIGSSKDYEGLEFEKQQTELFLGQNESKEQYEERGIEDYQESKQEAGDQVQWCLDENNYTSNHCLQRCSMSDAQNQPSQHGIEKVEDEEDDPQPNRSTLGVLTSNDIFQEIGTTNINYSPSFRLPGHSSGDLFQPGIDAHLNPDGMSMLVNSLERDVSHNDRAYHHTLDIHHSKRQMSGDMVPPDFNQCIEEIHFWASKAKAMHEEKERTILKADMNQKRLSDLQHQKDTLVEYIQNTECELEKRKMHSCKLEHEIRIMNSVLEDYRNALKQSRRAFSEYRDRYPEPEEPLYKDAGPGGLVLSTMELEKRRLEREEEERMKRCMVEELIADFEARCINEFNGYKYSIHQMDKRLLELEGKVELYKVVCAKQKMAER